MQHTKKEIEEYLREVKEMIIKCKYHVSQRDKNRQLFIDYDFTHEKMIKVLMNLTSDNFCNSVVNEHPKFQHERLYIFESTVKLFSKLTGDDEIVNLYIKFNKIKEVCVFVISFHKQEFPLPKYFR